MSASPKALRKPRNFKVCIFDSPLIYKQPKDFIFAISYIFKKSLSESEFLLKEISENGCIVVEITNFDVAMTRGAALYNIAKSKGLLLTIEVLPLSH